jgi:peptidoglycan/xylan/chitin deacetylase (PgdA/CDA1 family)
VRALQNLIPKSETRFCKGLPVRVAMTGLMAARLPILTFHAIDKRSSVISISPTVFLGAMAKLYHGGYHALPLMQTVDFLRRGAPFPDRSFVITFDDGYQSVYEEAFSVLERYGMSATVFLTVGDTKTAKRGLRLPSMGERSMLSWKEIQEMQQAGIEFGAHTLTHPDLTHLSSDQVKAEVREAKSIIEDALSAPVTSFAYPYGRCNGRVREIVQEHFACACSDELGLVSQNSDLYALERVDTFYLRTDRLFSMMLTRFFPWYIWACSVPRRVRRAFQRWSE